MAGVTWRMSNGRDQAHSWATGWLMPPSTSAVVGRSSGRGTPSGMATWWSSALPAGSWKEQVRARMAFSFWEASTRRTEKERPSRSVSTVNVMGCSASPGRMK